MIDGKIRISVEDKEWQAYPKEKRDRMKKILIEKYGIDISQIIDLENEGEDNGGY